MKHLEDDLLIFQTHIMFRGFIRLLWCVYVNIHCYLVTHTQDFIDIIISIHLKYYPFKIVLSSE